MSWKRRGEAALVRQLRLLGEALARPARKLFRGAMEKLSLRDELAVVLEFGKVERGVSTRLFLCRILDEYQCNSVCSVVLRFYIVGRFCFFTTEDTDLH